MADPYFDEILPGHDCCKDYEHHTRPLSIRPYRTVTTPRGPVGLWAKGFHLDCAPECLAWRISNGGGSLREEFGQETVYYAPAYNDDCGNNATIDLICGGKVISHAYVSINMYTPSGPAYLVFHPTPKLFEMTDDPDQPLQPISTRPMAGSPRTWQEQYFVSEYLCDGSRLNNYLWAFQSWKWQYNTSTKKWWQFDVGHRVYYSSIYRNKTWFAVPYEWGMSETVDLRSDAMKKAGCCPRVFLPED